MKITIISVGAQSKSELATLIDSYTKRLPGHVQIHWHFVKHGRPDDTSRSIEQESESILRAIPKNNTVVVLDETGTPLSSPELSKKLFAAGTDSSIIIGGAYGVSSEVLSRADTVLSLGKLVYPHQIVRLMVAEQIYRSYTIHTGHPYHHS